MQDCVSARIGQVDVIVVLRLDQINESFYAIVLHAHEQNIFVFGGSVVHVGPALLQELDHLDIAMQGCVQQWDIPFIVSSVHPGS